MGVIEVEIAPGVTSGMFTVQIISSSAGDATETVELDVDDLVWHPAMVAHVARGSTHRGLSRDRLGNAARHGGTPWALLARQYQGRGRASAPRCEARCDTARQSELESPVRDPLSLESGSLNGDKQ
jgi:hypothetical protein